MVYVPHTKVWLQHAQLHINVYLGKNGGQDEMLKTIEWMEDGICYVKSYLFQGSVG